MKRLALAAFAATIAFPCLAADGPPESGTLASFEWPVMVCDTQAQIASVVDAAKAKPDGGAKAKYEELKAQMDAKGEQLCTIETVMGAPINENVDLGTFQLLPDKWAHGWAVRIGVGEAAGWMLYLQPTTGPAAYDAPMLLPHGLRAI